MMVIVMTMMMMNFLLQEHPRPEYAAKCTMMEANPITGKMEPYFPQKSRTPRLVSGYAVIILMVRYFSHFSAQYTQSELYKLRDYDYKLNLYTVGSCLDE